MDENAFKWGEQMTKQKTLVSLVLAVGVWSSMAFSCNTDSRRGSSSEGAKRPSTTAQSGPPTEEDVKSAIRRRLEDSFPEGRNHGGVKVNFESPVRVVAARRLGVTNDMYYEARIDYTATWDDGIAINTSH